MYNKDIKEGFIQDYITTRVVSITSLYGLFRKIEPFEEKLNKDCSAFSRKEALQFYKDSHSRSVYTLMNNNVILKSYYNYMKYYHSAQTESPYETITIEDLKPCVDRNASKLLSREEVTDIEDNLLNYTDKAICEALFEGLAGESMCDLTGIEVDMINHQDKELILPDGRVFELTDRLYELLMESFSETEYLCYGQSLKVKKLNGSGKLYKERDNAMGGLDTADKQFRWVYRKVKLYKDHVGIPNLTMKILSASGFVHYLREGVKESGLDIKAFLLSPDGEKLMDKYRFSTAHRVDNLVHRYKAYI